MNNQLTKDQFHWSLASNLLNRMTFDEKQGTYKLEGRISKDERIALVNAVKLLEEKSLR